MSENDHFLARWSRRKLEAGRNAEVSSRSQDPSARPRESADPAAQDAGADDAAPDPRLRGNERGTGSDTTAKDNDETKPAFDLAALPPIESIGPGTDISGYLQSGVPPELTRAALRRVWATDPAIRDFVGIAENQWDFTAPNGVPGFGSIESLKQVQQALEQFATPPDRIAETIASGEPTGGGDAPETANLLPTGVQQKGEQQPVEVQVAENQTGEAGSSASQNVGTEDSAENIAAQQEARYRRTHGGALPH